MLDKEAREDIKLIEETAKRTWGENCEFLQLDVKESPYAEFELQICLYQKVKVGIYYDRSALGIRIWQNGKDVFFGKFTEKPVFWGFKAMKPENLEYNFNVLDEVIHKKFL